MKSLFIMTHNMAGGGCEHVIAQLANRFASEGTKVTVLTEYSHESFFCLGADVRLIALSTAGKMTGRLIPSVYRRLRTLVKLERPDAVLAMPEKVNVWTVLFLIGTGIPVIVSERNDPRHHPENKFKRFLRWIVYPFASGYVFQTEQQKAFFPESIRSRSIVLDNPLDVKALPEVSREETQKTVVTAARLEPQKNLSLLIESFHAFSKRFPEYRLIIYGEGSERKRLESIIKELGLSDMVTLPGAITNVPEKIRHAGMFVLSSDFEGMPNALIEAMAMGLPCVSTACPAGGPESLICNEVNGLLVPTGDSDALRSAMERIAGSDEFASYIGTSAVLIRERFDISVIADCWRNYVDSIIKKSKKR